jgi:PHD/YefM family antitoxin component YafN of YafNO toxin-antitoxin module
VGIMVAAIYAVAYTPKYAVAYERRAVGPVKDIHHGEILSSSRVRKYWSDTLNAVEEGAVVYVTREDHEPATIIARGRFLEMLRRIEELEEALEVEEILSRPGVREAIARAENDIDEGRGLSLEEAFGS